MCAPPLTCKKALWRFLTPDANRRWAQMLLSIGKVRDISGLGDGLLVAK